MIPKVIHYCWLSGDPIPEKLQRCMDSWKKFLPDYEFVLWDLERFDIKTSQWVKEAFEARKYAFAADYIRLYAVYNYGGIYMDMDVEVVRPFDDLLASPYILGLESEKGVEAGVFGAERYSLFLKNGKQSTCGFVFGIFCMVGGSLSSPVIRHSFVRDGTTARSSAGPVGHFCPTGPYSSAIPAWFLLWESCPLRLGCGRCP